MEPAPYHVLMRVGDARNEVDAVLAELASLGVSREASGFHKYVHVVRAEQTVVMTDGRDSPIAVALRGRPNWTEPGDQPLR